MAPGSQQPGEVQLVVGQASPRSTPRPAPALVTPSACLGPAPDYCCVWRRPRRLGRPGLVRTHQPGEGGADIAHECLVDLLSDQAAYVVTLITAFTAAAGERRCPRSLDQPGWEW